jgi:hypothetical protein
VPRNRRFGARRFRYHEHPEINRDRVNMKKPKRSSKRRGTANRQEVRKLTRRVNVPRSSQRPVERSRQRRSRRP